MSKKNSVSRICPNCGNGFEAHLYIVKKGQGIFCGSDCRVEWNDTHPEERFWRNVDKNGPNGCWLWTGYRQKNGYGETYLVTARKGVKSVKTVAHRLSWIIHNGPIPDGLFACHKCDNPPCVNPDHLFLGTHQDNMDDEVAKGRSAKGDRNGMRHNPFRGEDHPMVKLTNEQVLEIRQLRSDGSLTTKEASVRYDVSVSTIKAIVRNKTWKHLI